MLKRNKYFILTLVLTLAILLSTFATFRTSHAKSLISSIQQLNSPEYTVGTDTAGPVLKIAMDNLPKAEILKFNDLLSQFIALKGGKIDALTGNELEVISAMRNGLENIRILPGYLGSPIQIAAGISDRSKIPNLREKFNAFIAQIKADGTFAAMQKRWVDDNDMNMPFIDVPEKSDIHLTVGTTGLVMPFSFYVNSEVTGFDVELARRFAAHIGAEIEFKTYGFGSVLMSVKSGAVDIALSNLYVTPENKESITLSDTLFELNCVVAVRDDSKTSPALEPEPETGKFEAFRGKRIAVFTGSVQHDMVKKAIPSAEILYFESPANMIASLKSGKIDAIAADESIVTEFERENQDLTHVNENIGQGHTAFLFPKSPENNPLADEVNEYIRRMKSDGTLNELRAAWSGEDESKKVISDYSKLPAEKGTLRIAVDNTTPVFSYMRDRKLVGYDVDIIVRFCKEKGYKPEFSMIDFPGAIPAVGSGKCDIGMGGITITPERAETVRFSEPIYSFASFLVIRKPEEGTQSVSKKNDRIPAYKHLSDFDGKPIGMQPGIIDWDMWVAENLPHSKVLYYNTYPDLASALKTHKIEGFLVDYPVLAMMSAEDNSLTAVDEQIGKSFGYSFFYAKTESGKKLCDEMSEFIRKIKASGELDAVLSKWQGADEASKIPPDFKSLPAKNGTLTYAAEGSYPPFSYYKGTKLAGIDLDLAVRFCEAYGYGLDVQIMFFDATLPAVQSGKIDFAGDFTPSEEHEEAVYYSEPYCEAFSVMACLKDENEKSQNSEFDSLVGKRIGVQTGTTCAELVPERIPSAKLSYYDSLTDELTALRAGKVDAICCSLPAAIFTENADPTLVRIDPPLRETYLYPIFANNEKGKRLCDEYSAFLKTLWDNGTIDKLNEKWLGSDESARTVEDYSQFPNTNGSVRMAVDTSLVPFAYVKDNRIVGYDVDLAAMFCKAKGYSLEVENMPLTGVIASVKSGKSDFTQSLNKTPEREENTVFASTPAVKSGNVLLTVKSHDSDSMMTVNTMKLSDFKGKKIGLLVGSDSEAAIEDKIPGVDILFFESLSHILPSLRAHRIDAFYCAEPTAINMIQNHNDLAYVPEYVRTTKHTTMFSNSEKGRDLCREYADFLTTLSEDGTIDKLADKWIDNTDVSSQVTEDYSNLPAPNGTLKMAVTEGSIPFVFVKDKRIQGYDIDLAVMFCKAKGYGLKIEIMNHNGVLSSLETGKCDFSYSVQWTEERTKTVIFSPVPNAVTGSVLVVLKPNAETKAPVAASASNSDSTNSKPETQTLSKSVPSFFDDVKASFWKTFIREERWKLFIEGIANTMIITVMSIFCGILLGFTAFMFCRTGSRIANALTKFSVWLIKGTPNVVLIMILYYIIFGHVNISGIVVSIIAFTLTFGTSVYRMLTFGTGAVDKGQTEAAYALGFTDLQTFFTVVLPQAALHFMPSFKEEVTLLIKSTSIVGYIAVQDLTKMGDIVRSRTYEAFFPLIAVAAIYFVLAGLLNIIVTVIHTRITPSKRKPEDILRGIKTEGDEENHD